MVIIVSEVLLAHAASSRHAAGRHHGSLQARVSHKVHKDVPAVVTKRTAGSQISPQHTQATQPSIFSSIGRISRSSWSFLHGKQGDRDAVIHAQNMCWSPQLGVFYLGDSGRRKNFSQEFPPVNLVASAPERDHFWQPSKQVKAAISSQASFRYLPNTTLFIMGTTWPYHMSHFFANNGLPLLDVMRTYYQDWRFTGEWLHNRRHLAALPSSNSIFEGIQSFKFEKIMSAEGQPGNTGAQLNGIICYGDAVIGLNNTCAHNFCANHHADKHIYRFLRDLMWKHYLAPAEANQAFTVASGLKRLDHHAVIVQRKRNRHMVNVDAIAAEFVRRNVSHEVVYLEKMSFRNQVRLFSLRATIVVAVHGNAIGHFLWAQKQTVFIEVFPFEWHSDWQELLIKATWKAGVVDATGIRYAKIECLDRSCSQGMKGLNADVSVNCTELGRILESHVRL